ncbi:L-seryl-tRNA(Sec) selenium transferase [Amycolatopsis sp. GA6-003]|uniref:L-seryl-tRNA(Sec) selenium transferase n=1 Tax=Amycolatopsis sp. GA6-003 TaxID=2652444 RepID=UPI003916DD56
MTAPDPRRALPKVDTLLTHPLLAPYRDEWGRAPLAGAARHVLDACRTAIGRGEPAPNADLLAQRVVEHLDLTGARRVRAVINATGVVLHTNLGRSPLSSAAREAVLAASGYSTVEFDLATGGRGKRGQAAHAMLRTLTGAPGALIVNNAAAALLLSLGALARGKEVVVSRGELIEIGGEFRIPSIMEAAGVTLVEVGTTNRTHLRDYAEAITDRTALLLLVHPSNYRIEGFTASPSLPELAALARQHRIPLLHDIGSGLLRGTLGEEPTVDDSLRDGADLVVFSGDKLFGGPQAGMVVGAEDLVAGLARHPIARAVRIDKLTLAALEATLLAHLSGRRDQELPVWRSLRMGWDDLHPRAQRLAARLGPGAEVREGASTPGGGSLPGQTIRSPLVHLTPRSDSEAATMARLRHGDPPVIARTEKGRLVIDLRTVDEDDDDTLAAALLRALQTPPALGNGSGPATTASTESEDRTQHATS